MIGASEQSTEDIIQKSGALLGGICLSKHANLIFPQADHISDDSELGSKI